MNTIELLSNKFSQLVNEQFTAEELALVVERNATTDYADCCATHDFCDANMIMDEAFTAVMGREIVLQDTSDCRLWSDAWSLSKERKFIIQP